MTDSTDTTDDAPTADPSPAGSDAPDPMDGEMSVFEQLQWGALVLLIVAAASILAKVFRDELMVKRAERYPQYGWDSNYGYGTVVHRKAIREIGPSPFHRSSFKLE